MTDRLRTLADLAALLQCAPKTARRRLNDAMVKDLGLHVTRRGRTILFTDQQFNRVIQALQWRCTYESAARFGMRPAPSGSVGKAMRSGNSAQEQVRELTQRLLQQPKNRASGKPRLQALPGGRAASP
jgi:hypothetical protein